MNYAKLKNNYLVLAPNLVRYQNTIVLNPDAEKLMDLEYKPVTYTEPQSEAPEGWVWCETWTETPETIMQGWELIPEGDIDPESALDILLGGEVT